jgi:hypothetical protein
VDEDSDDSESDYEEDDLVAVANQDEDYELEPSDDEKIRPRGKRQNEKMQQAHRRVDN